MRLGSPSFADKLVGREAFERFQPTAEVVGGAEFRDKPCKLGVFVIVVALDGRVLDRPVHALDVAVGSGMRWLGQSMLDVEISAGRFEGVAAERHALGSHRLDVGRRPPIACRLGEARAIIRQHDLGLVGNGFDQVAKEVACDAPGRLPVQFDEGELGRPVNGHQEIEPAFRRLHFSDVDMEKAERIGLEFLLRDYLAINIGKPANAMTQQAAVQ